MIILLPPIFDDDPGFRQTVKLFRVKAFPPKRAIEALIAPILPGFPRRNATGLDALLVEKRDQGLGHQLRPIV